MNIRKHAGVAALVVAVVALFVALSGIAGAQKGTAELKVVQRTAELGPVVSGNAGDAVAKCNGNETAVGGGYTAEAGFGRVDGSRPQLQNGAPTGWHVFVGNDSPGNDKFQVQVLCARIK